jgi:hypothetical protein
MNDRIRSLYELVLNEGYDTSLEREYTIETSLDGIKELAESIGIDTSIIRVEYIAEQLGFVGLLNESTGEMVYILEKFDLNNVLNKIKQGFGKVDEFAANKIRKFIANNISHSYLRNKAVKELNKIDYEKEKKELDAYIKSSKEAGKATPKLASKISNDIDNETVRRYFYPSLSGEVLTRGQVTPTKPLKDIMRNTSPKIKDNLFRREYGLTSGLINSDIYSKKLEGEDGNAFIIDDKGNKKKIEGQSIGHAGAEAKNFIDTPLANYVFIRNIDKPYESKDFGKRDSIGRLIKDIGSMTRTYPHELRHVEDRLLQGSDTFNKDTGTKGYIDDPREIRAREAEWLVGEKKMKFSAIPALVKGVGENIYKKITGKGTGSQGDTMEDTYENTLKKENPDAYEKFMKT